MFSANLYVFATNVEESTAPAQLAAFQYRALRNRARRRGNDLLYVNGDTQVGQQNWNSYVSQLLLPERNYKASLYLKNFLNVANNIAALQINLVIYLFIQFFWDNNRTNPKTLSTNYCQYPLSEYKNQINININT